MSKMLSEHFTLEEMVCSQTACRQGIDNTPDAAALRNLRRLAAALERVRSALGGRPVIVSSGYRSPALNAAIGGSKSSAHMSGLAADFIVPAFGTVLDTARAIADAGLGLDQLIFEHRWVHLGLAARGSEPRGELLTLNPSGGYMSGLVDMA